MTNTISWEAGGPGSFRSPPGITHVRDRHGNRWRRNNTRWTKTGTYWIRWRNLVTEFGPLTNDTTP